MNDQELANAGYTEAARERYRKATSDYSKELHKKALKYAEADKSDSAMEVTAEHVRHSAHNIASSYGKDRPSKWNVYCQVAEHLCTAAAGLGGGAIKETWGTITFLVSIGLGVILFIVRQTSLKS